MADPHQHGVPLLETGLPEIAIDPEGPAAAVAPALSVRHQTLARGRIWRNGHLRLEFADGDVIDIRAHARYEAWEASGGDDAHRMFLVSPIAPDTCG